MVPPKHKEENRWQNNRQKEKRGNPQGTRGNSGKKQA